MLLQHNYVSGSEVQEAVKHQLAFINQDRRQMRPALTTLQIIHSLETCAKNCKNLAEYCIFMIEGKDIRHSNDS
jgi:phosphate transport system protein